MDIRISKSELNKALSLTQSIVERKTTMPILTNVLLSASEGELKVSATDLEITAVTRAVADVTEGGSTTVNAKVFSDIVRELPEGDVTLKLLEQERLLIETDKTKMRMIGVSAEEYPSLPGIGMNVTNKISSSQLSEMVAKTLYAVSTDETRFNLNGVCFSIASGEKGKERALRMVATDGHRLAMITRPIGDLNFEGQVIVPRKGLAELRRILDSQEDVNTGIDVKDGFLIIDTDQTKISMRLIDGEFPDYRQVLPKQKGAIASVESGKLAQAIKRAALMVTDKGKCLKLDFVPGRLKILTSSPELGDASEELEVQYQGEPLSVGFNARYLLEVANSIGEEQMLNMELHGALGPGRFFAEGDESYIGIIMPMRLS